MEFEEKLEHAKRIGDIAKKNDEERLREHWEKLKPFNEPHDVPNIPIVDKELYESFYVPRLIRAGAIPKKDLIDGQVYIGEHRRCNVAKWDKEKNHFTYNRHKFSFTFEDRCNHFEDDNGYALFVPIKLGKEEDY